MASEQILTMLSKLWKPILVVFGAIVTYLFIYFKGRNDGKMRGEMMLKDAEVETSKRILEEKESNEKKQKDIDHAVDALPDEFDSQL